MLQQTTKRLFYNKWPIKVECYLAGASKIARLGIKDTILWCDDLTDDVDYGYWVRRQNTPVNKIDLKKFAVKVENILQGKECKVRCEGSHYHIFFSDTDLLDQIQKELYPWIQRITAPENKDQHRFLIANGHKKVLCSQYPHDKFRYKIYIRDRMDLDTRKKFLDWLLKYPEKCKVSGNTEAWLKGSKMWVQDPFFYVVDAKMLSMILLYLGDSVKKIQEHILKSDINTRCLH
jgi:hypothetical protein